MSRIAAGKLLERVTLQEPHLTADDDGETVKTWRDVWTVSAEVIQSSAAEIVANGNVAAKNAYAINIRYRDDVQASWRIVWGDLVLAISKCTPIGRREGLSILAFEVKE